MASTKFTGLESSLKFWENLNKLAGLYFQLAIKGETQFKAAEGSELSKETYNALVRDIKNYDVLRKRLESGKSIDSQMFLPRIPAPMRGSISTITDMLFRRGSETMLLFPWFLANWLKTKKVCRLNFIENIPQITPTDENYLPHLPGSDFILHIPGGLLVPSKLSDATMEFASEMFFVHKDVTTNRLHIYGIDTRMDNAVLDLERIISAVQQYSSKPPKKEKQKGMQISSDEPGLPKWMSDMQKTLGENASAYKFPLPSSQKVSQPAANVPPPKLVTPNWVIDLNTGYSIAITDNYEWVTIGWEHDRIAGDNAKAKVGGKPVMFELVFILNGLCKLLVTQKEANYKFLSNGFEASPEPQSQPQPKKDSAPVVKTEEVSLSWYEVQEGNTIDITIKRDKQKILKVFSVVGGKKCPHYREPHPRTYRNKDGSVRFTINIKELWVHEKEAEDKQLKGSLKKIN